MNGSCQNAVQENIGVLKRDFGHFQVRDVFDDDQRVAVAPLQARDVHGEMLFPRMDQSVLVVGMETIVVSPDQNVYAISLFLGKQVEYGFSQNVMLGNIENRKEDGLA